MSSQFFRCTVSPSQLAAALVGCVLLILSSVPVALANDDVAVIIGNKNYGSAPTGVEFAHRDAEAMRKFIGGKLGYTAKNTIDLRDATKPDLEKVFGTTDTFQAGLWRLLDPRGGSNVIVYYSGHGGTGLSDGQPYLLPVDADPAKPADRGYPLAQLFDNLSQLQVSSISLFLDTDFLNRGGPQKSSPGTTLPSVGAFMSVLTATQNNQRGHPDRAAKHGMFTAHLLDALQGVADTGDYGDNNGTISLDEIKAYLDHRMSQSVRRRFGVDQTATLLGLADAGFYSYRPSEAGHGPTANAPRTTSIIDDTDAKPSRNFPTFSDTDICIYATKKGGIAWETVGANFRKYIDEAEKRTLNLKKCEALLANLQKSLTPTKSTDRPADEEKPTRARNSRAPFDGSYQIVAECSGANDWKIGAIVTDGVMIIRGRTGWKIEGKFNAEGEIVLEGTVHTTDRESLSFWAEAKMSDGQLDGRSIFTGRYAPVSCSFNGDRL